MPLTRQDKERQVVEIVDKIKKSKSIIFWEYHGLDSQSLTDLRRNFLKADSNNIVYKNRVAKIAFEKAGKKEVLEHLVGPTSFLFNYEDNFEALKILYNAIKNNEIASFKAGYIDGEFYTKEGVLEIASLPSKDELISMLLSVLQAPMRTLAYSLAQVSEEKPKDKNDDKPLAPESAKEDKEVKTDKPVEITETKDTDSSTKDKNEDKVEKPVEEKKEGE